LDIESDTYAKLLQAGQLSPLLAEVLAAGRKIY